MPHATNNKFLFQAWRKRWLVIEFPTCDSDEVRSSSILVRVYVSHHHENKGPPAFCIPILDVHGLHRIQSRSASPATTGVTIKTRCKG